jgi:dTDP-4-dehydrorhamnose reductase
MPRGHPRLRNGETRVDIEDAASVAALFGKVQEIDAVVNCAATNGSGAFGPLDHPTA